MSIDDVVKLKKQKAAADKAAAQQKAAAKQSSSPAAQAAPSVGTTSATNTPPTLADFQQQYGLGAGTGQLKVFFGNHDYGKDLTHSPNGYDVPQPSTMTQDAAESEWFNMAPAEQQAWANKFYRAGIISDPSDYDAMFSLWKSAVAFAGGQYTTGGKQITPYDVLNQRLGIAASASGGSKTSTSTHTDIQHLDPEAAKGMVTAVFQNLLGRDPTQGEVSRYGGLIINKVAKNPTVTKTTTTTGGDLNNPTSNSTSTTSGGVSNDSLNQILNDKTKADPEYGAYQAATTYFNAMQDAFGSVGWWSLVPLQDTSTAPLAASPKDALTDPNPVQVNTDLTSLESPSESPTALDTPTWGSYVASPEEFSQAMSQGSMSPTGFSDTVNDTTSSGTRESIVKYAKQFLGINYVWGGNSPSGFDCSGLVQYVAKHFGLNLPRISAQQANSGTRTSIDKLQAGDLVAWDENGRNVGADHIAFYIGNG
jgi:cell wall-associated NlpC family hydrolase